MKTSVQSSAKAMLVNVHVFVCKGSEGEGAQTAENGNAG